MESTNQIGLLSGKIVLQNKYDFEFSAETISVDLKRLTNQLWKLIPMREHQEDWKKQIDTVIIEIAGLHEIFMSPLFLQILSKLEGMRAFEMNFELFRKTVFECISLLQELNRGIRL